MNNERNPSEMTFVEMLKRTRELAPTEGHIDCSAYLDALQAEAERRDKEAWEPLSDGRYLDGALAIDFDSKDIGIRIDETVREDWRSNYEWLSESLPDLGHGIPENIRLCRLTDSQPSAPVTIPDEVREAIEDALEMWPYDAGVKGEHELYQRRIEEADMVRSWLEAQKVT